MLSALHNLPESISQVVILYFEAITWYRLRWYMHNDVHKVTARNKWRVLKIETFVCMRYASALSAVHNMAESISQVILYFRRSNLVQAEVVHA
jgi:hypothetical protein